MTTKPHGPFIYHGAVNGELCGADVTWTQEFTPLDGYSAEDRPVVTVQDHHVYVTAPLVGGASEYGPVSPGVLTLTPTVRGQDGDVALEPLILSVLLTALFWEDGYLTDAWTLEWMGGYANYTYTYRAKLVGVPDDAGVVWRFTLDGEELPIVTNGNTAEVQTPLGAGHGELYATYIGVEYGPLPIDLTYGS